MRHSRHHVEFKGWIEFWAVAVFFASAVLLVVCGLHTITSGWHLVDDHDYLRFLYQMRVEGNSLLEELKISLIADSYRFRPLYQPVRVIMVYLFGGNTLLFHAIKAAEIIIAMIALYYLGRNYGAGIGASILFPLICYFGPQSAIWWKLGPQEAQGAMWFAITLLLLQKYLRSGGVTRGIISFISMIIMALYKESFLVTIPFFIAYIFLDTFKQEETIQDVLHNLHKLKGSIVYIVLSLLFLFGCTLYILSNIGSEGR